MQRGSAYAASIVDASHAADPLTLLALRLNGEPLHLDHGYPCRLIAPNRPGAMQTKWVHGAHGGAGDEVARARRWARSGWPRWRTPSTAS